MLSDGWLRTGDVGKIDQGSITLQGRKEEMITTVHKFMFPSKIESMLRNSPLIKEAYVFRHESGHMSALIALSSFANMFTSVGPRMDGNYISLACKMKDILTTLKKQL